MALAAAVAEDAITPSNGIPAAETVAALRWASQLPQDWNVLSLLRAIPKAILEEQVRLYRIRDESAVAVPQSRRQESTSPRVVDIM